MHFQLSFKFLEKVLIWLTNVSSIEKLQNSKVESFLKPLFDLNQTCKIVLHKTIKFGTLIQMSGFIFHENMLWSDLIKLLWSHKNCQKIKCWKIEV